jgi:glycosyltransferase involved in cell wall biosynthesis
MSGNTSADAIALAIRFMGGDDWTAGPVYVQNLLQSLNRHCHGRVRPFLLLGDQEPVPEAAAAPILRLPAAPSLFTRAVRKLGASQKPSPLEQFLIRSGIHIVFGPVLQMSCNDVATLSWLPDFQHRHLPEMFSTDERRSRDEAFTKSAELSTRVILPSVSALADFRAFAPALAQKARALHPISQISADVYSAAPGKALKKYPLPEKFFYFPGQLWKHKNHEKLFEAVQIAHNRGIPVQLVCTGRSTDNRWPDYPARLLRLVKDLGIGDRVHYLGVVPRPDLFALMRRSAAVINPSLFEGWGMTIDEARSFGKPLLLSDIAAHRDQNPPQAIFFDPLSPDDIAAKLASLWNETTPGPDPGREAEARLELESRDKAFAAGFESLLTEVLSSVRVA